MQDNLHGSGRCFQPENLILVQRYAEPGPLATSQLNSPLVSQTIDFPATATASSWDRGADRGRDKYLGPMMQIVFVLQT